MVAPGLRGKLFSSISKPTLLALASRGRSAPSPSLKSIIAWTRKFFVNQRDSLILGKNRRCLPRIDPPRRPVTKRSSPALPPARETHRPLSTQPATLLPTAAVPRELLAAPLTAPTPTCP